MMGGRWHSFVVLSMWLSFLLLLHAGYSAHEHVHSVDEEVSLPLDIVVQTWLSAICLLLLYAIDMSHKCRSIHIRMNESFVTDSLSRWNNRVSFRSFRMNVVKPIEFETETKSSSSSDWKNRK